MEDVLVQLIAIVQQAAPALWEIMRRQVYVNVVQLAIGALASTVLAIACAKAFKHYQVEKSQAPNNSVQRYDADACLCLAAMLACVFAVATIILILNITSRIINPDYYAIELLLQYVRP